MLDGNSFFARFRLKAEFIKGKSNAQAEFLSRPPNKPTLSLPVTPIISLDTLRTRQSQVSALQRVHNSPLAGHPGITRSIDLAERLFPGILTRQALQQHIRACSSEKVPRRLPFGALVSPIFPECPFEILGVDLLGGFPPAFGLNSVFVIVDYLTRFIFIIPFFTTPTTRMLLDEMMQRVFSIFGFPRAIIADRGPQFTSHEWKSSLNRFSITPRFATTAHPQGNGLAERVIQQIIQYIRSNGPSFNGSVLHLLACAAFAHNNALSASTGMTPAMATFGRHLAGPGDPPAPQVLSRSQIDEKLQLNHHESSLTRAKYANAKRLSSPDLSLGTPVWLSTLPFY
jgi:Integrase core domain